jgi:hypothetical protein
MRHCDTLTHYWNTARNSLPALVSCGARIYDSVFDLQVCNVLFDHAARWYSDMSPSRIGLR